MLIDIRNIKEMDFNTIYDILKDSFLPDEYRSFEHQKNLLKRDDYRMLCYLEENKLLGFFAIWDLPKTIFIEHFVVLSNIRNRGIGFKMLKELKSIEKNSMVLEVELPTNNLNRRRIKFYERSGFFYNDYEYSQPPLDAGKNGIDLRLMTYPEALNTISDFKKCEKLIYKYIYPDFFI